MIEYGFKEKRLFMSFTSFDVMEKPEVSEDKRPPSGLFASECKKGILWAVPVDVDWRKTIVDMVCAAPNYADLLVFFTSDDYHKVDKLKWEQMVYTQQDNRDVFQCIDDSLADKYAEFIVPHESVGIINVVMLVGLFEKNICFDKLVLFDKTNSFDKPYLRNEVIERRAHMFELMERQGVMADIRDSKVFYETDVGMPAFTSNKHWVGTFLMVFDVYLLPMYLSGISNGYYDVTIPCMIAEWSDYCDTRWNEYIRAKNALTYFFQSGCEGKFEEYDRLREPIYDFFDMDVDIYLGRLQGYERNAQCPCGSGRKWKKCHGRRYV